VSDGAFWMIRRYKIVLCVQGNVDKVVVLIKDKEQAALERFMFSVQNMIQVEQFNKDTRLPGFPCRIPLPDRFSFFLFAKEVSKMPFLLSSWVNTFDPSSSSST
jgi:hypothetical protein